MNNKQRWIIVVLVIAWCFDQFFWRKEAGISFPLFVLLCLAGGVYLTRAERSNGGEGLRPRRASLILLAPIGFFAIMTAFRREPFSVAFDVLLTLSGMMLLAMTWLGGRWISYTLSDYLVNGLRMAGLALVKPWNFIYQNQTQDGQRQILELAGGSRLRLALSLLVGLILALPVVLVLGGLLASADPVFSERLTELLKFINIELLDEYVFRLIYILILAYVLLGSYLYALYHSPEERLVGRDKPWLPRFLGWIEAATVLASVDLLFGFFVAIQFRYFFGGRANINLAGFTYAEYARRGFEELVVVAVFSLLLFLSLSQVTRRQASRQKAVFSGLGTALVVLVAIILVSAFQRLLLYEAAYGFTRLRAYTHVFMIWLAILLVATAALELADRLRGLGLALVLVCCGFGLTLNLLNVDAFIVRQNLSRAAQGAELDTAYLAGLSEDAIPAMFDSFLAASTPENLRQRVGGSLACWREIDRRVAQRRSWLSWHRSRWQVQRLYDTHQGALSMYTLREGRDGLDAVLGGKAYPCE